MARRSRQVSPTPSPTIVSFGDDSGELRIRIIRSDADGAYLAIKNGSAPDLSLDSDDDDTILVPEIDGEVVLTENAPSGAWNVHIVAIGGGCLVQLTDNS